MTFYKIPTGMHIHHPEDTIHAWSMAEELTSDIVTAIDKVTLFVVFDYVRFNQKLTSSFTAYYHKHKATIDNNTNNLFPELDKYLTSIVPKQPENHLAIIQVIRYMVATQNISVSRNLLFDKIPHLKRQLKKNKVFTAFVEHLQLRELSQQL